MYHIHNMPLHAYDYKFIIFRTVDDDAWYWGADNDPDRTARIAAEIGGSWCYAEDAVDA